MITKERRVQSACKSGPLVLFDGDKGGPGKSCTTRVAAWRLLAADIPVTLFDGDVRRRPPFRCGCITEARSW